MYNGTVYYRTRSFEGYGKLSKKNIDDLEAGHRDMQGCRRRSEKEDPVRFRIVEAEKRRRALLGVTVE